MRWKSLKPSEHQEMMAIIEWAAAMHTDLPEANLVFAIPNGSMRPQQTRFTADGKKIRFSREGKKLQKEGVRSGIPDLFLPVARREWHGLFIELKTDRGAISLNQKIWIGLLTAQQYAVCVCRGAEVAIAIIKGYLNDPKWSPAIGNAIENLCT